MAWNQQGGGGQGPWGRGPGTPPPDVEELLRRSQDKFKNLMPGGISSPRGFILIVLGVIAIWMLAVSTVFSLASKASNCCSANLSR